MSGIALACLLLASAAIASAATVFDDLGHPLQTTPPVTRVVTLSPHTTEILYAAGGKPLLVGAARHSQNLSQQVAHIDTLGGIDRELMLQLAPDLVLAWASGNRANDLAWLEAQGIRVFRSEPGDMQQLAESIRAVGRLIGRPGHADRSAAEFLERMNSTCAPQGQREVYVSIWDSPAMSLGGRHWLNDVLALAGLHNTYADVSRGVFSVERESLLARQHLLQLAPGGNGREGRQIPLESLSRPGTSLARGIELLCRRLGHARAD